MDIDPKTQQILLGIERQAQDEVIQRLTNVLLEAADDCKTVDEAVDYIASYMGITL